MAKKHVEEFNPWPPFVDIFSSVILVILLFLLIVIVNLGYYAQFKFKVSYTGTIATDNVILNDNPVSKTIDELKDISKKDKIKENKKKENIKISEISKKKSTKVKNQNDAKQKDKVEKTEVDYSNITAKTVDNQNVIAKDKYIVINFKNDEIIIDDKNIEKIKEFISKTKIKFPKHKVYISSGDNTNQISSTISKQITLARTLNIRNVLRKLNYKNKDLKIKLSKTKYHQNIKPNPAGYILIRIKEMK